MNIVLDEKGWHFKNLTKREWQLIIAAIFHSEEITKPEDEQGEQDEQNKQGESPYAVLAASIKEQIEEASDDT